MAAGECRPAHLGSPGRDGAKRSVNGDCAVFDVALGVACLALVLNQPEKQVNEGIVLTSLLAWFVFKDNFDRRIFLGTVRIVAASQVLPWDERPAFGVRWETIAILGACLCWARKVSASDAVQIAGAKGLVAGSINLGIAMLHTRSHSGVSLNQHRRAVTAPGIVFTRTEGMRAAARNSWPDRPTCSDGFRFHNCPRSHWASARPFLCSPLDSSRHTARPS